MIFQPDHIKCQLSPEILAAIGIQSVNKQNTNNNPYVARTNPPAFYQQHGHVSSTSMPPMSPRHSMMPNGCYSTKPSYSQLGNPNMYLQQQPPGNRALSASAVGLPQCYKKYKTNTFALPGNQGFNNLSRTHYNPVC